MPRQVTSETGRGPWAPPPSCSPSFHLLSSSPSTSLSASYTYAHLKKPQPAAFLAEGIDWAIICNHYYP